MARAQEGGRLPTPSPSPGPPGASPARLRRAARPRRLVTIRVPPRRPPRPPSGRPSSSGGPAGSRPGTSGGAHRRPPPSPRHFLVILSVKVAGPQGSDLGARFAPISSRSASGESRGKAGCRGGRLLERYRRPGMVRDSLRSDFSPFNTEK